MLYALSIFPVIRVSKKNDEVVHQKFLIKKSFNNQKSVF